MHLDRTLKLSEISRTSSEVVIMAKFWMPDDTIMSSDRIADLIRKGELKDMDEFGNDYIGGTLEEETSGNDKTWNKVITGTKRNSDGTPNMGDVSDGYHTFDELYEHSSILFLSLLYFIEDSNEFRDFESLHIQAHPWYSKQHDDGSMFPGMFIAGMSTEYGSVAYHFDEKYLPLFEKAGIKYLEKAPEWDGNSPEDGLEVLKKLVTEYYHEPEDEEEEDDD